MSKTFYLLLVLNKKERLHRGQIMIIW